MAAPISVVVAEAMSEPLASLSATPLIVIRAATVVAPLNCMVWAIEPKSSLVSEIAAEESTSAFTRAERVAESTSACNLLFVTCSVAPYE